MSAVIMMLVCSPLGAWLICEVLDLVADDVDTARGSR